MKLLTNKFIFVRHGNTDWDRSQIMLGPKDYSLNQEGRQEVQKTAITIHNYLTKNQNSSLIISSKLKRAKETAEIISRYIDIPILGNTNLNERYFGHVINNKIISQEKEVDFDNRICKVISKILDKEYHNLILVSHYEVFYSLQKCLLIKNDAIQHINKGKAVLFLNNHNSEWEIQAFTP